MFWISKKFNFEAAHYLPDLPEGHQCARVHGHSYMVQVFLTAEGLRSPGFVVDFGDLAPVRTYIQDTLDHRDLNDVFDFAPTSELLAQHFYEWCSAHLSLPDAVRLERVRVSETASTYAEYQPEARPDR